MYGFQGARIGSVIPVLAALVLACAGEPRPPAAAPDSAPAPAGPPPPPAAPSAEANGGWTQGPVDGGGNAAGVAILTDVRTAAHDGYDRIVFEFTGGLPGYRVVWLDGPAVQCGSGEPVQVPGEATVEIAFEPAAAHDDDGRPTLEERARRPGLDSLVSLELICDFEAHVDWVAGASRRTEVRVAALASPPRLVVDLRH